MLGRKRNGKRRYCLILSAIFFAIAPNAVLAEQNCFTAGQIAGVIFVTSFTTFCTVIGIAMLLWYFYRNPTIDKNFIAAIDSDAVKSGKIVCSEQQMDKMENKAVEAMIAPAFTDKMTSCSSLTCKRDDDVDDDCVENQKVQQKQQQGRCVGSQIASNDLSSANESINILEDVVRCLLDKDTSALGFQIAQGLDGICISYVEPNGPADRSGNIFVGDKIKELTITFENMSINDALTILSCASTYKIRLELERAIINDAIQPDYVDVAEEVDTSETSTQQHSSLCKSHSTSDLKQTQMSDKSVSGGSFASKQKYQLPQQTVINTINEEAPSITPETLSSTDNSRLNFMCKNEFAPNMMESVISEETIIISDPLPVLENLRTSSNEISIQSQNSPRVITSETYPTSNCTPNSTPSNISRQQPVSSSIPVPFNSEHNTVLSLMPEENCIVNEINCNGFSEYVERSHFMYSNTTVKDSIQKNCIEFCELIEPKRDSIVIEFEEEQKDNCCYYQQQSDEEMIKPRNCNNTFDGEVNDKFYRANSNCDNSASSLVEVSPTTPSTIPLSNTTTAINIESEKQSGNITDRIDIERNTSSCHLSNNKNDPSDDQLKRMNAAIGSSNFSGNFQFSNNSEQIENLAPKTILNHTKLNEANNKPIMKSGSKSMKKSPIIQRMKSDTGACSAENNRRSSKRSGQLRKLSDSCGINEIMARKEVRKLSATTDDLKDKGNNECNISQRSPKWSPKPQSHIPVINRIPSTKSKNKPPKVDDNRTVGSSVHNKIFDDTSKNDMNGASLYIAKKEALRKTYLPFSKMAKSEEMDLNKERKARLEANQALLQQQQDELRTLGILP